MSLCIFFIFRGYFILAVFVGKFFCATIVVAIEDTKRKTKGDPSNKICIIVVMFIIVMVEIVFCLFLKLADHWKNISQIFFGCLSLTHNEETSHPERFLQSRCLVDHIWHLSSITWDFFCLPEFISSSCGQMYPGNSVISFAVNNKYILYCAIFDCHLCHHQQEPINPPKTKM